MTRLVVAVGAMALVLAACGSGGADDPEDTAPAATEAAQAGSGEGSDAEAPEGGGSITLPADICELFDGIDVAALISTTSGAFVGSDDECSVPAEDPLAFAQASITTGVAPAMIVIRSNYEGPLYECDVVDVDGLGDEAFSCLGGTASSSVVFAAGEHLVIFSAGNNVAGPPGDTLMLDAAQAILANMGG